MERVKSGENMELEVEISVIVTIYNLEKYIKDCLDSILEQEEVNFEVICIDDASIDSSFDILCDYQRRDARVKVIRNKKNMGLSSSRNAGFRIAKGEYIYNIDGDDMLVRGALRKMYECAKKNNLDLLGFSAQSFFDSDLYREYAVEGEYSRKSACNLVFSGTELFVKLYEIEEPVTSNMCLYCIRNNFIKKNNLYDTEGLRYVDDSMFLKYMVAQRVMCISDVLYRRRYREGSAVTSPMKRIYLECMIVLFAREFSYWQQMELGEHENKVISRYFLRRMQEIDSMQYMFRNDKTEMKYLDQHLAAKFLFKNVLNRDLLYEERFTDREKQKILSASNLIIYGAGYFAEKVTDILEVYNKRDYNVVISGIPQEEYLKGHKVYGAYEVQGLWKDALVLVAVSRKYKAEIREILSKNNVSEIIWFD